MNAVSPPRVHTSDFSLSHSMQFNNVIECVPLVSYSNRLINDAPNRPSESTVWKNIARVGFSPCQLSSALLLF